MLQTLLSSLRKANGWVAILIGVLLMACVAFVLADIALRQMGSSLGGTDEISGYVMAIATSWGMGYTLTELGHVRIDILRSRAAGRGRAVFDLLAMLALSGTISLIAIRSWPVLERSLANSSRANTPLETPLALVQAPWLAGWVWFSVVAWLIFVAALALVLRGEFDASEAAIGTYGELEALE
jgi:TRAP-type C4-dicarboxylate transport system permease small subunit